MGDCTQYEELCGRRIGSGERVWASGEDFVERDGQHISLSAATRAASTNKLADSG